LPRKKRLTRAVGYDLNAAKEPGTSEQSYEQPEAKEFQASIPANSGACVVFHRTHHNPLFLEGLVVDKRFSQKMWTPAKSRAMKNSVLPHGGWNQNGRSPVAG
jgi:hypothetical protein